MQQEQNIIYSYSNIRYNQNMFARYSFSMIFFFFKFKCLSRRSLPKKLYSVFQVIFEMRQKLTCRLGRKKKKRAKKKNK